MSGARDLMTCVPRALHDMPACVYGVDVLANGKRDKAPRHPKTRRMISLNAPADWVPFSEAAAAAAARPDAIGGVGVMMRPGVVGIDIDDAFKDDGTLKAGPRAIVKALGTWAEVSMSGRGIHAFCQGEIPEDFTTREAVGDDGETFGLEVYGGHAGRYIALTGHHLEGTPTDVVAPPAAAMAVLQSYKTSSSSTPKMTAGDMPDVLPVDETPHPEGLQIREACRAFLIDGEHSGDRSRALFGAAVALYKAGLSDAQVLSVLAHSPHALEVAMDHRGQDYDRAVAFLWEHQCVKAKPKAGAHAADDFDDVSEPKMAAARAGLLAPITEAELSAARTSPRVLVHNLLFACVRTRLAAGGVGKTTLALFEAVMLALGRPLWGREPPAPVRTALVTREDDRELLVARLREIMDAMRLGTVERANVLARVRVLDMSAKPFRLTKIEGDVVTPAGGAVEWLVALLTAFAPDWVIFDPLVSFGTGESRVNDAEQGLIEAARIIKSRLQCCVELVHHTGKQNAREKALDQYAGRGGSALADGARMVAVLQPLESGEWLKATGTALAPGESGLVMALPKLSYAPPQDAIYIRRRGYLFTHEIAVPQTPAQEGEARAQRLFDFLQSEFDAGRKFNQTDLCTQTDETGLSRDQIRAAITTLKVAGRIVRVGAQRSKDAHFMPVASADSTAAEGHRGLAVLEECTWPESPNSSAAAL